MMREIKRKVNPKDFLLRVDVLVLILPLIASIADLKLNSLLILRDPVAGNRGSEPPCCFIRASSRLQGFIFSGAC